MQRNMIMLMLSVVLLMSLMLIGEKSKGIQGKIITDSDVVIVCDEMYVSDKVVYCGNDIYPIHTLQKIIKDK